MTNDLPPGWAWATIDELCDVILGQSPPGSSYNGRGEGIPFFQGKAEFGDRFPSIRKWTTEPKKHAPAGSVLLSVRAPVGPTNVAPVDCAVGRGLAAIRPLGSMSTEYLLWAVRHSVDELVKQATGSTFEAITGRQLRSHRVAVAPLAQQERIVAAIEEHFSRLDAAEFDLTAAYAKSAFLPSIVVPHLFSGRWPTRRLGELARVGSGATPKRSEVRYWAGGTIPWVTSGAVNDQSITSASELITEKALAETSVKLWPAGTVLVAMYGEGKTRGKAAVLEIESTCNQACAAIDYNRSLLNGEYLMAYLNSRYEANRSLSSGGVQPNLSLGVIKSMEIPIPSLTTQETIALQAQDIAQQSDLVTEACAVARRRITALL